MERPKNLGGRPTKLTPEVEKKICDAIRAGAYIETAAAYAGVSKQTLYTWMKRGNAQKSGIYRRFLDAIEKALAESEMRDLIIIGRAAEENWQAAAWRLERKFPERWARKDRMTVDTHHSGSVNLNVQYVAEWGGGNVGEDEIGTDE